MISKFLRETVNKSLSLFSTYFGFSVMSCSWRLGFYMSPDSDKFAFMLWHAEAALQREVVDLLWLDLHVRLETLLPIRISCLVFFTDFDRK